MLESTYRCEGSKSAIVMEISILVGLSYTSWESPLWKLTTIALVANQMIPNLTYLVRLKSTMLDPCRPPLGTISQTALIGSLQFMSKAI